MEDFPQAGLPGTGLLARPPKGTSSHLGWMVPEPLARPWPRVCIPPPACGVPITQRGATDKTGVVSPRRARPHTPWFVPSSAEPGFVFRP